MIIQIIQVYFEKKNYSCLTDLLNNVEEVQTIEEEADAARLELLGFKDVRSEKQKRIFFKKNQFRIEKANKKQTNNMLILKHWIWIWDQWM